MLSFRSIFIAATTFATISSAIPAQAAPATPNIPVVHGGASDLGIGGRDGLRGLLGLGEAAILTAPPTSNIFGATGGGGGVCGGLGHSLAGGSFLNSLPGSHGRLLGLGGIGRRPATPTGLLTKRSPTSPGDVFKTCSDGVELVVVKIVAAINVEGGAKNIDHGVVIGLLGEIVVLLQIALLDLKVIVVAELTLNGVACTLRELAGVIVDLILLVIKVIWLVLSILGFFDVDLCGIITIIVALLCELLEVVLALVAGLKVEIVEIIKPFVDLYGLVFFVQILVILGLHV